jgi:hypothetical protein
MRAAIAAALAALTLAGCAAAYESRIRGNLIDAGLSPRVSTCIAERMVDRLSTDELQQLARIGRTSGRRLRNMSIDEFLHTYRDALDPHIYKVLARAGIGCAIAG